MSYSGFSTGYNNPMADLGKGFANAQSGATGTFNKFRNNRMVSGTTDFLYSNSLVAKVCFLILIIILFVISLRLGSRLITWLLSPSKNPILVNGLRKGTKASDIFNVYKSVPQKLVNITVKDKKIVNSLKCKKAVKSANNLVINQGRLLVRQSGTEPKIRIMCESFNKDLIEKCINIVKKSIN